MHFEAQEFVREQAARLSPRFVVEIGAYNVNGGVRHLFPDCRYIGVDVRPGPDVDVVADGAEWRPDTAPDVVVCCETLEHTPPEKQRAIVENAYGMLAPQGTLIVTAATDPRQPHSIDGELLTLPSNYWNVQELVLLRWLTALDDPRYEVTVDDGRGDLYLVCTKQARAAVAA
jgi:hypothetical protein